MSTVAADRAAQDFMDEVVDDLVGTAPWAGLADCVGNKWGGADFNVPGEHTSSRAPRTLRLTLLDSDPRAGVEVHVLTLSGCCLRSAAVRGAGSSVVAEVARALFEGGR